MSTTITHERAVGDKLKPLGAVLDDGSTTSIAGKTVQFRMVSKSSGDVIVDWEAATVTSGTNRTVSYTFTGTQVDTAGRYRGWFRIVEDSEYDTYPSRKSDEFLIVLHEVN